MMRRLFKGATILLALISVVFISGTDALAAKIKVAGIYTQPIQQKWDARLHLALVAAVTAALDLDGQTRSVDFTLS